MTRHVRFQRGRYLPFRIRRRTAFICVLVLFLILCVLSETLVSWVTLVMFNGKMIEEQRFYKTDSLKRRSDTDFDGRIIETPEPQHRRKDIPIKDQHVQKEGGKRDEDPLFPQKPGRSDMDLLFAPHSCRLTEDDSVGAMRVRFIQYPCDDTRKGMCIHSSKRPPIIGFAPHEPAESFFPTEVLIDEDVRLHSLKGFVEESKATSNGETLWRMARGAGPSLRCVPSGDDTKERQWLWDSGGLRLRATLTDRGALEGTFSFPAESAVGFFGLPSRTTGLRLPTDFQHTLLNRLHEPNTILESNAVGSGTVPLVYAVGRFSPGAERRAVGILWLNGSPLDIRTTRVEKGTGGRNIRFTSTAGATRVFLLPGPTPADVLRQYYAITGFPMIPPLFALGYHHAHQNYSSAVNVKEVSAGFARAEIPVDSIGAGFGHMNKRHIFTWNPVGFSDPQGLHQQLWDDGGRVLFLATTPHVPVDQRFSLFNEGRKREYFVTQNAETDNIFLGLAFNISATWIDFLNPRARRWYAGLFKYKRFVGSSNHTFLSLELNEPSFPDLAETVFSMTAGHEGSVPHQQVHNIYGMLQTIAAYDGQLRRSLNHRRPFVITQSYFAGTQRYAAARLARSAATWAHLQADLKTVLAHSIAGMPFIGSDIGGYMRQPTEELLVRWYQLGVFLPLYRSDADETSLKGEIWQHAPHVVARIRDAVRFRYALLPYLYTLFWSAHVYGEGIIRPLFSVYPQDASALVDPAMLSSRFFLGSALFVAPILEPAGEIREDSLEMVPEAMYNFWDGKLFHPRAVIRVLRELSTSLQVQPVAPLFQRVGTILPLFADTSLMRSSRDAANYTLSVSLPSWTMSGGVASQDTRILAVGEIFLDDGSSYVSHHHRQKSVGAAWESCMITLECILIDRDQIVLRGRVSNASTSSCDAVRNAMVALTLGDNAKYSYKLTNMRIMFASVEESERVTSAYVKDRADRLVLSRRENGLLEVSGMAVSIVTSDAWQVTMRLETT